MTASRNPIRQLSIPAGLGGRHVLRLLIQTAGYRSIRAFADAHGFFEQQVHQAISGERSNATTSRILDAIAEATGKSRKVVDSLVAGDDLPEDGPVLKRVG